ncbi:hypothetical protein PanWU01x14_023320 [Parasponia andersonii]|uniref:RNase H type-1 domain-containing protein n=1 Tax=Parasponia andersonii TaxID=3476 RepID=A0A2P5DXF9_PARAD|nr:hypothetical protein PanWU01x14_023320 [Parasponia andersonii]
MGCYPMKTTKLLAIREGLFFVSRIGLRVSIMECDAKRVIHGLEKSHQFSLNAHIFFDVKALLQAANYCTYLFAPRSGNKVAYFLASVTLHSPGKLCWVDFLPLSISSLVVNDIAS